MESRSLQGRGVTTTAIKLCSSDPLYDETYKSYITRTCGDDGNWIDDESNTDCEDEKENKRLANGCLADADGFNTTPKGQKSELECGNGLSTEFKKYKECGTDARWMDGIDESKCNEENHSRCAARSDACT